MALRRIASFAVPILGKAAQKQTIANVQAKLDPISVVKPQRWLGAVWIDDLVALRKPLSLCEQCWRKYFGWWRRYGYHPNWNEPFRTDCDGCSRRWISCFSFHPEESFYKTYAKHHGTAPPPFGSPFWND